MHLSYSEMSAALSAAIMMYGTMHYIWRIVWGEKYGRRRINPVPATFYLMVMFFGLSLLTYLWSDHKSWSGNVGVLAGIVSVVSILVAILYRHHKEGTMRSIAFARKEKRYIAGGIAIVVFWMFTGNEFISYILVQILAILAYIATVVKLWNLEKSDEPMTLWVAVFIAALLALPPALAKSDWYGYIYLARGVPATGLVVFLLLRIRYRERLSLKLKTVR